MDYSNITEAIREAIEESRKPDVHGLADTLHQLALLAQEKSTQRYPLTLGGKYLIRTVTMIFTGELVEIQADKYVLIKAAWIPETNRWNESVKTGEFKEVEPYPEDEPVYVFRGSIVDIVAIPKLPRDVK